MRVVSYGAGVNSTAMLIAAATRGVRPDLILFADTGDERPSTYRYIVTFSRWLRERDFPRIEVIRWIRRDGSFVPLGQWCLMNRTLPSKAFGLSGCTTKWKQQPIEKRVRGDDRVIATWQRGAKVERWIGYDADEPARAARMLDKNPDGDLYVWRCPLVEWGMGREDCVAAIASAGLPSPGKSSCYFCPSMRKHEIDALPPTLLERALHIEDVARPGLTSMQGLGRAFSWRDYVSGRRTACEVVEPDCGCYDGE